VWTAAEELDVAIGMHEGFQPAVPSLGHDREPRNILVMHATSHTFEQMFACAQLIATGVLERHPALRVVFLEAGGGWIPYWLERLDHQVASYGGYAPQMKLTPSEYFARQCWISFEIDEPTLPVLAPFVGVERIVWGSDYPHADSTFPGAVAALRSTIAPLAPHVHAQILGENASQLYRLG
jgi:predicted TIM-barrel fold metal-dependent hydrolase